MKKALSPALPLLLLISSIAAVVSAVDPTPIALKPDLAPESLPINYIQEVGSCVYKITISTSCFSPLFTTDDIGVLFGDNHGNQIIELKLDNGEKKFDSCKTDTFDLKDRPCTDEISYLYIYKNGADNWLPDSVQISAGSDFKPLLFTFNASIPTNSWYGFDLRQFPSPPTPVSPWWSLSPPPPSPISHPPPPPPPPSPIPRFPPPPPSPIPRFPPPPPPEPILPPPPSPPSSSNKLSGQKWAVYATLGLLTSVALL